MVRWSHTRQAIISIRLIGKVKYSKVHFVRVVQHDELA